MRRFFAIVAVAIAAQVFAASGPADLILSNGKVVTVDDRFTITQAVAIKGQRVLAVGRDADIEKLAGPATRRIDLRGRTVIPGLIDNHAHWIRYAEHDELRFDGITSRRQALEMLAQRVKAARPGEWVVTLGGWSEEQFTDDPRGFPLEELDRIAPANPVVIQAIYRQSYLNSAAMQAMQIDAGTRVPPGATLDKGGDGKPTGMVRGAPGVAFIAAKIPLADKETWMAQARKVIAQLNAIGITAWLDAGGRGINARHYEPYQALANRGELNAHVFWTHMRAPVSPAEVDKILAEIPGFKPFQGSDFFDNVGYGEWVYVPVITTLLSPAANTKPDDIAQVRRIADALAERGIYFNSHVEMQPAIDAFLNVYEEVNRTHPIKGLRWSFSHLDQVTDAQLERMKKLGMSAQIHSRPLIQGALMHASHGERAWEMPPMRRVQDSGIAWGLGSDATAVTTSNPFYTLSFAVTGKMIGGRQVNRQTITREEALIAHTRNNAAILFQESNIGSLAPGKYADLLVLDRDYLTVPADEIRNLKPMMTMVAGKVVYEAR